MNQQKRRRNLQNSIAPRVDALEMRRLLSITLYSGGVLGLTGESGDDVMEVTRTGTNLQARVNVETQIFAAAAITQIAAYGGTGNDLIRIAADVTIPTELNGAQGNDTVIGGAGPDTVLGAAGDDSLAGGAGNDLLDPGVDDSPQSEDYDADHITTVFRYFDHLGGETIRTPGNQNTIEGGTGNDTILSGVGSDDIAGGDGFDTVNYSNFYARTAETPYAYSNHTSPYHGPGKPISVSLDNTANDGFGALFSFGSNSGTKWEEEFDNVRADVETVIGGDGNDLISGNAAANHLTGGPGNDTLLGQNGNDSLFGAGGNDTMDGGGGRDLLDGGANFDSVDYRTRTLPLLIRLDNLANDGQIGEADNLVNPEQILCGGGNDTVYGDARYNQIWGGAGNDLLRGGGGNDSIYGGAGADVLAGDDGDDSLDGQWGNDTGYGNAGNDSMLGGSENDSLDGGIGNDRIDGQAGNDVLRGHLGNDTLVGGTGNDLLLGLEGEDWLYFRKADKDTVDGGPGADVILQEA